MVIHIITIGFMLIGNPTNLKDLTMFSNTWFIAVLFLVYWNHGFINLTLDFLLFLLLRHIICRFKSGNTSEVLPGTLRPGDTTPWYGGSEEWALRIVPSQALYGYNHI